MHNAIRLVAKQVERVLPGQFNPTASDPGMAKLLEATSNILIDRKNMDSYNTNSVLQAARNVATAAATISATLLLIVLRPNAKHFTQAIMGAKEGVTEGILALVGSDITNTVLRSADDNDYKRIDEYSLAKLLAAAISGTDCPATTNVLDQLLKVITYVFDFCKKCSVNVEILHSKASKMAAFGVSLLEPIARYLVEYRDSATKWMVQY